jgi:histone H3/H4
MTDEEAAYHEAAHAIVAMRLGYACASVSIVIKNAHGDREGAVCEDPRLTQRGTPQQRYEDRVIILAAAEVAQRKIFPHGSWKANIRGDQADVLDAVIEHIGRDASEDATHKERRQVLAKVRPIAERLVVQRWHEIDRLAQDLLLKKKVTFDRS